MAPAIAGALEAEAVPVERTSGAETRHWRQRQHVEKSRAENAAATATEHRPAARRIKMTRRERKLAIAIDASGFPRRKKEGRSVVTEHGQRPRCGLHGGHEVRIEKA